MEQSDIKARSFKRYFFLFFKIMFALIILAIFYHEFFVKEDYWNGIYYPNGNSIGNAIYSSRLTSKEECIGWAINESGLRPEDANVPLGELWECNKNCQLSPEYNVILHATQKSKQELLDDKRGTLYYCEEGGFNGTDWLKGDFENN